jgi:hypothetical protein
MFKRTTKQAVVFAIRNFDFAIDKHSGKKESVEPKALKRRLAPL